MKNWTVRQRITWSFGAVITLMAVMGAFSYLRLTTIGEETARLQRDSVPGLVHSNEIMTHWLDLETLTLRHVASADAVEKRKAAAAIQTTRAQVESAVKAYEAAAATAKDRQALENFRVLRTASERMQDEVLKLSDGGDAKAADEMTQTRLEPMFDKAQAAIQALVDGNKAEADDSTNLIVQTIAAARTAVLVVLGVAVLLAIVSGYFLRQAIDEPLSRLVSVTESMRRADFTHRVALERQDEFGTLGDGFNRMTDDLRALVGQVQESGVQVNTSVNEIAATAKEQQATASEIAATTTEIGATSKEISATSKELVKTMNEVSSVAEQSATLAGSGQASLSRMEDTMRHVMEAAGGINAKLAVLNEKAGNINQVVTTITKVADQTNILSLNAAIEAEKAGEYGRGFAVVATEIRRLADQTAVATYDIEQMVKEMQSAVAAGVMGMDKFSEEVRRGMHEVQQVGAQLSQIIQQVQALAPRFEAVNEGMQAQATGAEQISQALTQLSEAAQQTVESLRQSGLAIDELNKVSSGLRQGISRFKLA